MDTILAAVFIYKGLAGSFGLVIGQTEPLSGIHPGTAPGEYLGGQNTVKQNALAGR